MVHFDPIPKNRKSRRNDWAEAHHSFGAMTLIAQKQIVTGQVAVEVRVQVSLGARGVWAGKTPRKDSQEKLR